MAGRAQCAFAPRAKVRRLEVGAVIVVIERDDKIAVRIVVLHGGFTYAALVARPGPSAAAHPRQHLMMQRGQPIPAVLVIDVHETFAILACAYAQGNVGNDGKQQDWLTASL